MIEVREELNELSSDTFQYVSFTLDLHGKRMVSVFKNHQFVNDLDLDTVSLKISQIISFASIKTVLKQLIFLLLRLGYTCFGYTSSNIHQQRNRQKY